MNKKLHVLMMLKINMNKRFYATVINTFVSVLYPNIE